MMLKQIKKRLRNLSGQAGLSHLKCSSHLSSFFWCFRLTKTGYEFVAEHEEWLSIPLWMVLVLGFLNARTFSTIRTKMGVQAIFFSSYRAFSGWSIFLMFYVIFSPCFSKFALNFWAQFLLYFLQAMFALIWKF